MLIDVSAKKGALQSSLGNAGRNQVKQTSFLAGLCKNLQYANICCESARRRYIAYSIFQSYLTIEIDFLPTYLHLPEHHSITYNSGSTGLR